MKTTHRLTIATFGLAMFSLSAFVAPAQFSYETNNGAITITGIAGDCASIPEAVTIPATINGLPVTSIGEYAFQFWLGCSNVLTSVTIPNTVTNIGKLAFWGSGLTNVTIPNSVTSIGYGAFAGCTSLASVTIPSSVTEIGQGAFSTCTSLASITIPNSVISIGSETFVNCTSLISVVLGNSVTLIGSRAFANCSSLTGITIPDGVTIIPFEAFSGCSRLTSVVLGNSVTIIRYDTAFSGCASLTSIVVDSANPSYSSLDGVLFDKSQTTLLLCPQGKVGSYSIPNGVTRIAGGCSFGCFGAFAGCTSLTSVTIPNSVTNIGDFAFGSCTSLRAAYFQGNAPSVVGEVRPPFDRADNVTVYYLPGTTGWGSTFGGRPTAMWIPLGLDLPSGPPSKQLILHTTSPAPAQVRVQRGTNLIHWEDWQTVTKAAGPSALHDGAAGTTPYRFYRGVQE